MHERRFLVSEAAVKHGGIPRAGYLRSSGMIPQKTWCPSMNSLFDSPPSSLALPAREADAGVLRGFLALFLGERGVTK